MVVIGLLLAPFLPWSSWKTQLFPTTSGTVSSTVPVVRPSPPYSLRLREARDMKPLAWQLFVDERVRGFAYEEDQTYDVYGTVSTSTGELVFSAYDLMGEIIATATSSWQGHNLTTVMQRANERRPSSAQREEEPAPLARVSFEYALGEWEDPKRLMGCEFRLVFPTVEVGGAISRSAAEAINRELRAELLDRQASPEEEKETFIRTCRTELESEREFLGNDSEVGAMLQRAALTNVRVVRNEAPWLQFMVEGYSYTGGVHGASGLGGLLFDGQTGRRLMLQDLFRDEAAFRAFRGLVADRLLTSYGDALFDDWSVATDTSFLVTPRGVRMVFQQYEVAPYAVGMPTVDLPFSSWASLASPEATRAFSSR